MEIWINPACSKCRATDVARPSEPVAANWTSHLPRDRRRRLELMSAHPIPIQRPILTADDGTTVVGRSPVAVRRQLDASPGS